MTAKEIAQELMEAAKRYHHLGVSGTYAHISGDDIDSLRIEFGEIENPERPKLYHVLWIDAQSKDSISFDDADYYCAAAYDAIEALIEQQ